MKIRFLLVTSFVCLFHILEPKPELYNYISILLILFIGIPHGAADHKINSSINKESNTLFFIIKYILVAIGYIIWWIFMPYKAFLFFIIISVYHFGQEYTENFSSKSSKLEMILWGISILVIPMLISYPEIKTSIESLTNNRILDLSFNFRLFSVCIYLALMLILLVLKLKSKRISRYDFITHVFNLFTVIFIFLLLPFLVAFTIYFTLYHSYNAFKHQYLWLKALEKNYNVKSFIRDLSLFSLISIFGIVILFNFIQTNNFNEIVSYFFIIISIITLPHTILFDHFYKHRRLS